MFGFKVQGNPSGDPFIIPSQPLYITRRFTEIEAQNSTVLIPVIVAVLLIAGTFLVVVFLSAVELIF